MRMVVMLLLLSGAFTLAQEMRSPFQEHPEALAAAHGFELLELRLGAMLVSNEVGPDHAEQIEAALERDLPRFVADLARQDAPLAADLVDTLAELAERLESGGEVDGLVQTALALTARARPHVIAEVLRQDRTFKAALMALLLLTEEGLAERFEEAAEGEETAYVGGWATQQRIKDLWTELEPFADEVQRFEVNDMLAELDRLFPSPRLPESAAFMDPEAAEDPAQRITGFLEDISGASLYPDRDLAQLLGGVRGLVESGCREADAAAARQRLAVAGFYYAQYLGNTVAMFAPEPHETLEPFWAAYAEEEEEEEEEEEQDEAEAEREDDDDEPLECPAVLEGLEQISAVFGL